MRRQVVQQRYNPGICPGFYCALNKNLDHSTNARSQSRNSSQGEVFQFPAGCFCLKHTVIFDNLNERNYGTKRNGEVARSDLINELLLRGTNINGWKL